MDCWRWFKEALGSDVYRDPPQGQTFTSGLSCFWFRSSRTGTVEFNSTASCSRSRRRRAVRGAWPTRNSRSGLESRRCQKFAHCRIVHDKMNGRLFLTGTRFIYHLFNASISTCHGERILLRSLTSAGNRLSRCPRASGAFSRSPPPP